MLSLGYQNRLGAAGIEFKAVTLPLAANPACAIETPVRLKAVKLAPRWRRHYHIEQVDAVIDHGEARLRHWNP
jgi:hypothetical protein